MKINNLNSKNTSFGHISTRTIDMIRNQVEYYGMNTRSSHFHAPNSNYRLLNFQELKRLYDLSKRAMVLEKSVIDVSGKEEEQNQNIVVRSHSYLGSNRSNLEIFTIPNVSLFDAKTNDPKEIIDTLEHAVEYAEDIENDPNARPMFDEYGWHGGIVEDKSLSSSFDIFKNKEDNDLLGRIYDNTLNLRSIR